MPRPKDYPDHHDAELVLRLYDLRREASMREARALVSRDFLPTSRDELLAVLRPDHPLNTPFRQVSTYWEMAYGFARHGVLHTDFLIENNGGEGLLLFAKVEPWLADLRQASSPRAMLSAEWVATQSVAGRELADRFRGRLQGMRAQRQPAAPDGQPG